MEKAKWKWLLSLVLVSVFVWFLLKYVLVLFLPLVFAFILTRLVLPAAVRLKRISRSCPVTLSSKTCRLVVFFAYLLVIVCLLLWVAGMGLGQLQHLLQNIGIYKQRAEVFLSECCAGCDGILGLSDGESFRRLSSFFVDGGGSFWKEKLSDASFSAVSVLGGIGRIGLVLVFSVLLTVMALVNLERWYHSYRHWWFYRECHEVFRELTDAGLAYVRTQLIIMFCIAVICGVGLFLMGNPYAALAGIGIAVVDALPVLGSGAVFFPWIVITVINRKFWKACLLLLLYAACQLVRQTLEPRLMGKRIHAEPAVMLAAVFAGLKLFSAAGVFLGPVGYLLIRVLMRLLATGEKKCYDKAGEKIT
jgi:predicted PurR-regulated permease PerM